jgi:hydrogenase expression/formation protein HypE
MKSQILQPGKLPAALLRKLLETGRAPPTELLLPPAVGEDACAIDIHGGALIAATDPITLTGRQIGAHAVVINANDVAVMGVRPRWFLAAILLPLGTTSSEVEALFRDMHAELDRLAVTLVGGHTEITAAVVQPVVVGQMMGYQPDGRFIRTGGMRAGDIVLQIGLVPIEGAAVLANEAGERLEDLAPDLVARAQRAARDPGISIVEPALRAAELGATAMHDPTEGGLSAGLHELAEASALALRVDTDAALWFEPGRAICAALGADPWGVLASGTLLAAFPQEIADRARATLVEDGHPTARLGRAEPGSGVYGLDGSTLRRHEQDEASRILSVALVRVRAQPPL